MTRSRSHHDVDTPPPVTGPTDSPPSAYDPWAWDPPDPPPASSGQAFADNRRAGSFAERMRRAGIDPDLADRYEQPLPGGGLRDRDD